MTRPKKPLSKMHPPLRETGGRGLEAVNERVNLDPVDPQQFEFEGKVFPVTEVLAALAPHVVEARLAGMQRVIAQRLTSVVLGVEDLHKSHNGEACLRTAEALGLQRVVTVERTAEFPLPGDHDPRPRRGKRENTSRRITRHAHRWLDLHRFDHPDELRAKADAWGARIFGATPRGTLSIDALPVDQPMVVLFGNEAEGLREDTIERCDDTFFLPMFGFGESLNVSVAVGMALNALGTRRRAAIAPAETDLDAASQAHILARWLLTDLRAGPEILSRKLQERGLV